MLPRMAKMGKASLGHMQGTSSRLLNSTSARLTDASQLIVPCISFPIRSTDLEATPIQSSIRDVFYSL